MWSSHGCIEWQLDQYHLSITCSRSLGAGSASRTYPNSFPWSRSLGLQFYVRFFCYVALVVEIQIKHVPDIKRVRDPATCRELYFGWTKLCPEVANTTVSNVIKIFVFTWARLILFPAYLAMWRSYDEACSGVSGKIALYGGYWRNRKSMKLMNIGLAVLMMTYFLRSEPADE